MKLFYFFAAVMGFQAEDRGLSLKSCSDNLYAGAVNPELYASLTPEIIEQNIASFGTCLQSQGLYWSLSHLHSLSVKAQIEPLNYSWYPKVTP